MDSSQPLHVQLIVGTNRLNSVSGRLTRWLTQEHRKLGHRAEILDLAQLPPELYASAKYGDGPPSPALETVVGRIERAESFHVVLPEYNGAAPGALKYLIDLLPNRDFLLGGRPVAFVGVAAGEFGGLRPVEQIQSLFLYRKSFLFPERVFIADAEEALDPLGVPATPELRQRLINQARRFGTFARSVRPLRTLFATVGEPG
jgi:NAD(P)H-dependent FMN reductase